MAFSSSSATLATNQPHDHVDASSEYELHNPFSPSKIPTSPPYHYNDTKSVFSRDGVSVAGSSLTTGTARDSTYLIPTPITDRKDKRFQPFALRLVIAVGVPLSMISLAIALEVGIFLSEKNDGFKVPTKNVITVASSQFLLSIVPTLFVIPPAWVYRELDWFVRWYQPYVVMSRRNAKPEESVLLDYVTLGPLFSIINSMKFKHKVITWSTLTALATYLLQPLAGSMFQLQNRPEPTDTTVTSTREIGLSPDFTDLTAFVSSAGFAEAAVFNGLPDPPFIMGGWATAQFQFPSNSYLNGTMNVNTTAIQTKTNCQVSNGDPTLKQLDENGTFNITATSADGCAKTVTASNTSIAALQYGVDAVDASCNSANITQRPVMFWFYREKSDGTAEAKAVFCSPKINFFNVMASADLSNNSLTGVSIIDSNVPQNNLTGSFTNNPWNGVVFDPSPNPFIGARAIATNTGIPGAIFRFASQSTGGLDFAFSQPNEFSDITTHVYTQHLALVAKSIYFVPQNSTLNAKISSIALRLTINPLAGHSLAFFLFFIGFVGVFVHIVHRRQRRGLYLATPPGTIAGTIAMTAHSGFGELLMPYDDEKTLQRKLSDLRFHIDQRTGAIIANVAERPQAMSGDSSRLSRTGGRDEAMESLLGNERKRASDLALSESSTQAAYAAAAAQASYPPPHPGTRL